MIPTLIENVRQTVWGLLLREVIGANIPRIALARNSAERFDVGLTQFGATTAFFGGGWGLSYLLKKAHENVLYKGLPKNLMGWSHLGRSFGIYSLLGGMMWSVPFVRNYIIAKKYGTTDFTTLVGEKKPNPNEKYTQGYQDKLAYFKKTAITCVSIGAALSLLVMGGTHLAIRRKLPLKGLAKWLNNNLALIDGNFNNFTHSRVNMSFAKSTPWSWFKNRILTNTALIFWTAPIYGGWIHAARDQNERNESKVKLGAFLLDFYLIPELLEKGIFKLCKNRSVPLVGSAQNLAFLSKFGSSILFSTVASSLLGRWITHRKAGKNPVPSPLHVTQYPISAPLYQEAAPQVPCSYSSPYYQPAAYSSFYNNGLYPYAMMN